MMGFMIYFAKKAFFLRFLRFLRFFEKWSELGKMGKNGGKWGEIPGPESPYIYYYPNSNSSEISSRQIF